MANEAAPDSGAPRRFCANRDDSYKPWICIELLANLPELGPAFLKSATRFIESKSYTAFRIDQVLSDGTHERYGGGLLGVYALPFAEELLLGVEAAWFQDEDPFAHAFTWQYLVNEAVDAGMVGLAVNPATVSHPPCSPAQGLPHNKFGVFASKKLLMAGPVDAIWSAFVRDPTRKPQFVDCLRVLPQHETRLSGTAYEGGAPLFRGEGRVDKGPYTGCPTLRAVADRAFAEGFAARGDGSFSGTCQEQLLHQGYVPSPTVSMTAEFDVAAYYGTSAGRLERGLVFEIDPVPLRQAGPIWDTFASMTSGRATWLESDFEIVVKLVREVGDLREAGKLIEAIDSTMRRFRANYDETLQGTSADYERWMGAETWARLLTVLDEPELSQLCSVVENFFHWAKTPEGYKASSAYVLAFLMAQKALEEALEAATQWQHPGWDNTVFGYAAKTCRDREFLSSGPISGHCIRRAHLVDGKGRTLEVYSNNALGASDASGI